MLGAPEAKGICTQATPSPSGPHPEGGRRGPCAQAQAAARSSPGRGRLPARPQVSSLGDQPLANVLKKHTGGTCSVSASPGQVPSGAGEPRQGGAPGREDGAGPDGGAAGRGTWPQRCGVRLGHQVWLRALEPEAGSGVLLALCPPHPGPNYRGGCVGEEGAPHIPGRVCPGRLPLLLAAKRGAVSQ